MKFFLVSILTAIVTATLTWIAALDHRDETFAKLTWARCPQLILEPHHAERSFIQTLDGGYIPIRPRAPRPKN